MAFPPATSPPSVPAESEAPSSGKDPYIARNFEGSFRLRPGTVSHGRPTISPYPSLAHNRTQLGPAHVDAALLLLFSWPCPWQVAFLIPVSSVPPPPPREAAELPPHQEERDGDLEDIEGE